MRILAGVLVISGLGALCLAGFVQHDLIIAAPAGALAALWGVAMLLHWPRAAHTCFLSATTLLCALSTILKMPSLTPLICISTCLYGWDLVLLDLRLRSHPREATGELTRRYAVRGLTLGLIGGGVTLLARHIRVQLSFLAAFTLLSLCLVLFLVIQRHGRGLLDKTSSENNEKRTAKPPA